MRSALRNASNARELISERLPIGVATMTSAPMRRERLALQLELLQVASKLVTQPWALQRKFDSGFQKTKLVACVVTRAFDHVRIDRLLLQKLADGVGQLNLSACPAIGGFKDVENLWSKNVPADDGEIRWRFVGGRFLNDILNTVDAAAESFYRNPLDDTVVRNLAFGDLARRDNR